MTLQLRNRGSVLVTRVLRLVLLLAWWQAEQQSVAHSFLPTTTTTRVNSRSDSLLAVWAQKKRKTTSSKSSYSAPRPLTREELAHHVSNYYISGPRGSFPEGFATSSHETQRATQTSAKCSHKEYLKQLDRHPALVLNADYQPLAVLPLSLWSWQDAIKAIFSGKVTVVDTYPNVAIRAANLEVPLPSVIALREYVPTAHQHKHTPAFTKRNVFLRDEYRCQYCQQHFSTRDLSLDHVVPRSRGGQLNWENAVTSCLTCNGRKGSLAIHDLRSVGMELRRLPFAPSQYQLAAIAGRMLPQRVHPTWMPYIPQQQEHQQPRSQRNRNKRTTVNKSNTRVAQQS